MTTGAQSGSPDVAMQKCDVATANNDDLLRHRQREVK